MSWKESAQETINSWKAAIEQARVRANLLKMELRDEYDARLSQLQQKWQEAEGTLDTWGDDAETRWNDFKNEFEAELNELSESLKELVDGDDEREPVSNAALSTNSGSEGWAEGMGHRSPGESDYAKGVRDGRKVTDSEGWAEGMGEKANGVDDFAKGQRAHPKAA